MEFMYWLGGTQTVVMLGAVAALFNVFGKFSTERAARDEQAVINKNLARHNSNLSKELEEVKSEFNKELEEVKNKLNTELERVKSSFSSKTHVHMIQFKTEYEFYLQAWKHAHAFILCSRVNAKRILHNTDSSILKKLFDSETMQYKLQDDSYDIYDDFVREITPFIDKDVGLSLFNLSRAAGSVTIVLEEFRRKKGILLEESIKQLEEAIVEIADGETKVVQCIRKRLQTMIVLD